MAELLDPRDCGPEDYLSWARSHDADEPTARRLAVALIAHGVFDRARWGQEFQVPKRLSQHIPELPRLTIEKHQRSTVDPFEKLLFRTHDGEPLETVLIPLHKPGAVSLCLSSQIGCPMGCVFCATARMSKRRNLATWEIVDQFLQARQMAWSQGRRVTGAVFMGMGEPFLNYDRVMASAEWMRCSYGGAVAAKAITVSTVGLVAEIDRFTAENRRFRLSISLGAATDEKRAELVPIAARTPIADVMAAARRHQQARGGRMMLSYVCIPGFNMDEDDARALGELLGDLPVRFDLIEVTDPSGRFRSPTSEEFFEFRDALSRWVGQPIVRRYSGGADIQAACGTLAGV